MLSKVKSFKQARSEDFSPQQRTKVLTTNLKKEIVEYNYEINSWN